MCEGDLQGVFTGAEKHELGFEPRNRCGGPPDDVLVIW